MENLVPLGTGNSRLMKSNIPSNTTLAQLIQMWNNGTFPYDIGPLNSAGISQQGTPLNKDTLLKDATAALFGFGVDALPDDMFNVLTHAGDLHVWKRTIDGVTDYPVSPNRNAYQEGSDAQPAGYTLGEVQSGQFYITYKTNGDLQVSWQYGDINVDKDGLLSIKNSNPLLIDGTGSYLAYAKSIVGKFVTCKTLGTDFSRNQIYYIPQDANVSFINGSGSYSYGMVVDKYQTVTGYPAIPARTTIEYMGQVGDKARIETGSYTGTGTYGSSNPNSLTFGFEPKLVCVTGGTYSTNEIAILITGATKPFNLFNGGASTNLTAAIGQTTTWYCTGNANVQANTSGTQYTYWAIG